MIEINGKVYRNLQEQVKENMDDIQECLSLSKIYGPYATTSDVPEEDIIDYGMYLIGSAYPYELYQRKNNGWVDLGKYNYAEPGVDGVDALVFKAMISFPNDSSLVATVNNTLFNREPEDNDKVIVIFRVVNLDKVYISNATISDKNSTTCKINISSKLEITGPAGPLGLTYSRIVTTDETVGNVIYGLHSALTNRIPELGDGMFFITEDSNGVEYITIGTVAIINQPNFDVLINAKNRISGLDGVSIVSVAKTSTAGLVDTYTITYSDSTTSTFDITNGAQGATGNGISTITKTGTIGNVDTYTIAYTDGTNTTFTVTNGVNGNDGQDGNGISSISKTSSSGLVDTYTITYTNGTTSTFTVTNGADGQDGQTGATGNGISNISYTSSSGLVDTYTITFTNGTTTTFNVTNGQNGTNGTNGTNGQDGVGISNISKTSTAGLVDTYTITYTNSTTSTFTVTNGQNGSNGTNGSNGVTFTPSVSSAGVISWTNDGGLPNPQSQNIKGPQGDPGITYHLYQHNLFISDTDSLAGKYNGIVFTSSNTPLTLSTFLSYLTNNGYVDNNHLFTLCSNVVEADGGHTIGCANINGHLNIKYVYFDSGTAYNGSTEIQTTDDYIFTDTITQIF